MSNSKQGILQPKTVLVESTGMQHWLNLQLAQHAGIAMNIEFPMPTRFVWQICRDILGHDKVPMQSTYKREVMLWRIERLLNSDAFVAQNFEAQLRDYWASQNTAAAEYKRVSISRLIADTLEQYLMFRPKWLLAWENGESILHETKQNSDTNGDTKKVALKHEAWQRWIWCELAKEEPFHPVRLQLLALQQLENKQDVLPKEVYFFAINTMAPQTLAFFNEVAKYTQIHFFHLNPCVDYWGDAVSDRAIAKQVHQGKIDAWVAQKAINPLLRNLGQQGKDLFNLLSQSSHYEISAFDTENNAGDNAHSVNLLHTIQLDILQGQVDAELTEENAHAPSSSSTCLHDASIVVNSCHSALREVQVLHNYLLEQFSDDDSISPRDVLVMCPAIENYSPYIEAVFGKSITQLNNAEQQRIPCTIADRNPLDAEPLVAAFMQLLSLPDSRFNVTEFLSFLHLPTVMNKYAIKAAELDLFAYWVKQSNVHWGLNAHHKSSILGTDKSNDVFTWHWGMQRLLEGYSHADNDLLIDENILALNEVEGQLAPTFGKLLHVLEKLASYGESLKSPRTMDQWKDYLFDMRDNLFDASDVEQYASQTISNTLGQFFEHYHMSFMEKDSASNTDEMKRLWSYQTLRQALQHAFTSPDSQNQFMTGQVTFCSMMPMRSIPFKIIAVLGLNDGEFPRQSNFVDMDLVNHMGREVGDRSRRGDDRYLFLEAILSARKALYLSYQGKGIRDNKVREPSLVLSEFLAYLKAHHQFDTVNQQPLHPFSVDAFIQNDSQTSSVQRSYDRAWYRLMTSLHSSDLDQTGESDKNHHRLSVLAPTTETKRHISLAELIQFFKKPLAFYALHTQGLRLDDIEPSLSDVEPFKEHVLDVYSMKQAFVECITTCDEAAYSELEKDAAIQALKTCLKLSGKLPDFPNTEQLIDENAAISETLVSELNHYKPAVLSDDKFAGQLTVNDIAIDYTIALSSGGGALDYSLTGNHSRHLIGTWIKHLIICASQASEEITSSLVCLVKNSTTKEETVKTLHFEAIARELATTYLVQLTEIFKRGCLAPLLISPDLADKLMAKISNNKDFDPLTADLFAYAQEPEIGRRWSTFFKPSEHASQFIKDKYFVHYFAQEVAQDEQTIADILNIYQPLKREMKTKKATKARQ